MRVSWPLPTRNTFTPQYSAQLHRLIPDYFTLNQITNICTFTLHRKLNYLLHIHGVHIYCMSQFIIQLSNHTTLRTKTEHQNTLLVFNKWKKGAWYFSQGRRCGTPPQVWQISHFRKIGRSMDLSPIRQNFEKNRNRQKYHHSLKEHPTFTKIAKFGCEML